MVETPNPNRLAHRRFGAVLTTLFPSQIPHYPRTYDFKCFVRYAQVRLDLDNPSLHIQKLGAAMRAQPSVHHPSIHSVKNSIRSTRCTKDNYTKYCGRQGRRYRRSRKTHARRTRRRSSNIKSRVTSGLTSLTVLTRPREMAIGR